MFMPICHWGQKCFPLPRWPLPAIGGRGALAGQIRTSGFALLIAGALLTAGNRLGARLVGVAAAFIFLSTPWVVQLANLGLVEWAWSCYGFLAWFAWILWLASPGPYPAGSNKAESLTGAARPAGSWSFLLLAGYLGGAACGCKYPAVPFIAVPMILLTAIVLIRSRLGESLVESLYRDRRAKRRPYGKPCPVAVGSRAIHFRQTKR